MYQEGSVRAVFSRIVERETIRRAKALKCLDDRGKPERRHPRFIGSNYIANDC